MKAIEPPDALLRDLARRRRQDAWRNAALAGSLVLNALLLATLALFRVTC